jgi:hypothetical protein
LQLLYAAPFVLIAFLSFTVCTLTPSLRRFALSALVAPLAFGVCSLAGWIAFALISSKLLKINLGPAIGLHGLLEGLLFYAVPGIVASYVAVAIVRRLERLFLRTESARISALRIELALVAFSFGFILTLGGIERWFGWLSPDSWVRDLGIAVVGGILISSGVLFASHAIKSDRV